MAPTVRQYIIFISKTKAVLIRMWHLRSTFGTFFKESLLRPFGPKGKGNHSLWGKVGGKGSPGHGREVA